MSLDTHTPDSVTIPVPPPERRPCLPALLTGQSACKYKPLMVSIRMGGTPLFRPCTDRKPETTAQ